MPTRPILSVESVSARGITSIDFSVHAGQCVGLIGCNGSGKTSVLHAVSGLLPLDKGCVFYGQSKISDLSHKERAAYRFLVMQDHSIYHELTVKEYLMLASFFDQSWFQQFSGKIKNDLLEQFELDTFLNRSCASLSLGEKQRTMLCQAFVSKRSLVLLDEPTNALDVRQTRRFGHFLNADRRENNTAIVLVSHDMHFVQNVCDVVLVLDRGVMIACGTPQEILAMPLVQNTLEIWVTSDSSN